MNMNESLKPIEEGCTAVVTYSREHPEIIGTELHVGTRTPPIGFAKDVGVVWKVDKPMPWSSKDKGSYLDYIWPERYMVRIDGGSFEEEEKEQDIKIPVLIGKDGEEI